MRFWNLFLDQRNPWKALGFVFLGIFILRLPTLFVEYYDIDILTSFIGADNYFSGLPYAINKGPVYHHILHFSYFLFGKTPVSFHMMGIIIIALTSLFIYLLGKTVFDKKTGILGALFYGFCISAFNRQFMAINGEIVYNLFFTASFYFFYMVLFKKKYWFILGLAVSLTLGILTKFQGLFCLLAIISYLIFIHPLYYIKEQKNRKNYYLWLSIFIIKALIISIYDWNYSQILMKGALRSKLESIYAYVAVRGFNLFFFLGKTGHRLTTMFVYHGIIWIFGFLAIKKHFKKKENSAEKSYVIFTAIFLFSVIFLMGQRLYFHYFVQVYPMLSLLAASYLFAKMKEKEKIKRIALRVFLIPISFLFLWNAKDAFIANLKPNWFYQEGKALYYFRLIILAQDNDYLLPHSSYVGSLKFIKEKTPRTSKLFVWPEGAEYIFFSDRHSATNAFWYNVGALNCLREQKNGEIQKFQACQQGYINAIKQSQANYFIDVSNSPRSDLYKHQGMKKFPVLQNFLNKEMELVYFSNAVKIYKRKP